MITLDEFLKLRNQLPVVDVRSEGEYGEGHIPGAINIPILNNAERVAVGTDYKQKGQPEAIKTGFRLVGPRIASIVDEAEKVAAGKEMLVHCWRGGMRSANFCHFMTMAKMKTHQLQGGYKAYRQQAFASYQLPFKFYIVGGYTGSGKSELLRALKDVGEQVIDLEALAQHKGSAFGGLNMPPQPTTEQFQNELFEVIRTLDLSKPVWIEDESINIGKIVLPEHFWATMTTGPVIELDVPKDTRVHRLVAEYGNADPQQFLRSMQGVVKKLGGQNFNAAKEALMQGNMHKTIDILLHYYDKAYQTGLSKKVNRIKARVTWNGINARALASELQKNLS